MKIRADSTEYIKATITTDHDITGQVIEVAVPAANQAPVTWYAAEVTDVSQVSTNPNRWKATYRVLVGPAVGAATALAAGSYDWTVRVTDNPEVPVRKSGTVTVTDT